METQSGGGGVAAISQTHLLRVDNWLISQALALCDGGGGFCRRKKASRRAAAEPSDRSERGECGASIKGGAEVFNCSWVSTGIRLRSSNKLIRESLSQIAKTEGTTSEVAADLAMEEYQGQGEGENTNHGEHDQCLAAALMHGWFFEVAVGGDGLKHFCVDDPTTAA